HNREDPGPARSERECCPRVLDEHEVEQLAEHADALPLGEVLGDVELRALIEQEDGYRNEDDDRECSDARRAAPLRSRLRRRQSLGTSQAGCPAEHRSRLREPPAVASNPTRGPAGGPRGGP